MSIFYEYQFYEYLYDNCFGQIMTGQIITVCQQQNHLNKSF